MNEQPQNDYEREPVPAWLRRGWLSITLVWIAIGIDLSSMLLGSQLASGLSLSDATTAIIIGSLILGVMSAICAYVGAVTNLSTAMISRIVFGGNGAKIVSAILSFSLLGWFGVQTGFFAQNARVAIEQVFGLDIPENVLAIIGGLLMMSTAIIGYRSIEKLSIFAVPLLFILVMLALYMAIKTNGMVSWTRIPDTDNPIPFGVAVSLVIGIFVSGTVTTPDVARWARSKFDAALSAFLGFLIGNSFMLIVALLLSKVMSDDNLTYIFLALGLGIPSFFVLTLAQWTTNTNNLYSAGLGLSVLFQNVPKRRLTFYAGIFATAMAYFGIFDHFTTFLEIISILVPPIGGVYLAEYFFVNKQNFTFEHKLLNWRVYSIMAWVMASLVSFMTSPVPSGLGLFKITTIPALDGFLTALILQTIIGKIWCHLTTPDSALEEENK